MKTVHAIDNAIRHSNAESRRLEAEIIKIKERIAALADERNRLEEIRVVASAAERDQGTNPAE